MYRINMKQAKTAWKRSEDKGPLKTWMSSGAGRMWVSAFQMTLSEKDEDGYAKLIHSEEGVLTPKLDKLTLR